MIPFVCSGNEKIYINMKKIDLFCRSWSLSICTKTLGDFMNFLWLTLFAIGSTFSATCFANVTYDCKTVLDGKEDLKLKILSKRFSGKLKGIEVTKLNRTTGLSIKQIEPVEQNLLSKLTSQDLEQIPFDYIEYANSLSYQMISTGGILGFEDYYYFSNEIISKKSKGVFMIREDYSYGPFPGSRRTDYGFYTCSKI